MDIQTFCHRLPKVELHAHLNGSLSSSTLTKLYKMQNSDGDEPQLMMDFENVKSLKEAFNIFIIAHSLTNTPQAVFIATCDVITEFFEDNVIYLELRSTPRAVEGKMTKKEYVEAIITAIRACETRCPGILVKLLISVDRKRGYQEAKENIELAIALYKESPSYVIGVDLSGNPTEGNTSIELLEKSRKVGLKISAHCAEVPNEIEVMNILNFKPDRLGHCTCIHPNLKGSEKLFRMLLESLIPVELCLTSNVKCGTVPFYESHQFKYLYEAGHPICIATDDKGVFKTTLSKELELIATHFKLKKDELKEICKLSIQYSFASNEEKNKLIANIDHFDC